MDQVIGEAKARVVVGTSNYELVLWLHSQNLSILDSIKTVRAVREIPLGEAKEIVSSHPAWREAVLAAIPLQEEAIAVVTEMATESDEPERNDSP